MNHQNPNRREKRRPLGGALQLAVVAAIALFVALLAYGLVTKAPNTDIDGRLAEAKPAPAPGFELPVLQRGSPGRRLARVHARATADGSVSLAELRGTPVVLNFWASWCVPCQQEAPLLERSWRRAAPHGVLFLGLNMQDIRQDARDFMHRYHNSYLNIRDKTNDVARKWGVTGLPETFFITPRGEVVAHVIGVISRQQMRNGMAAARSGRPLGALEGGERRSTR